MAKRGGMVLLAGCRREEELIPFPDMPRLPRRIPPLPAAILCPALAVTGTPAKGVAQDGLRPIVTEARPILDARMRYEHVQQEVLAKDAHAPAWEWRRAVWPGSGSCSKAT
jgi:hypothetical protein